jgi:hypothetical protein
MPIAPMKSVYRHREELPHAESLATWNMCPRMTSLTAAISQQETPSAENRLNLPSAWVIHSWL